MVLLNAFLPALSQAGTQAQSFHWRRLMPAAKRIPIFLPTCVPAQALQKLPSSLQLCLIHPLAAGVRVYLGKEPLGSRLASVVDVRHPVAWPVRTAGGGATRPAVMDGTRSGARKAIYGARAHRDRFGPAK